MGPGAIRDFSKSRKNMNSEEVVFLSFSVTRMVACYRGTHMFKNPISLFKPMGRE